MKKIMFITTFLGIMFFTTLACYASLVFNTDKHIEYTGTLISYEDNPAILLFEVNNSYGVDFSIEVGNSSQYRIVWIFNDNEYLSPGTATWSTHLDTGSYEFTFYGNGVEGNGVEYKYNASSTGEILQTSTEILQTSTRKTPTPTPLPGALVFMGTGIVGVFIVRKNTKDSLLK
ncbi:exported hypothetical protein [Desulfamplus magnetovallimortis]|uniref:Uncharacterized protein n=1 Tax=Desulfamplus magnetovallimortis TaxID=1246637 RepID=A0A1W1HE45_9BACT|nr:hypothetical protein [Desulfamplus magnetovallimortis]SLM30645.1 exported hypothetical protein [Desulfamplus magnetovallimortis]